jgi:DNA replication licensing factor MCM5
MIRISEAVAKIHLDPIVEVRHLEEAHRLFKISTLNAAQSGMTNTSQNQTPSELTDLVRKIEDAIKRRVAIGNKISYVKL